MKKRPFAMVDVTHNGTIFDTDTAEVVLDNTRTKLVRAYANSVERCIAVGAPTVPFKLIANKDGRVITAFGPITLTSVDIAYPGCTNAEELASADNALNIAHCTRGTSPAGRALDYAIRSNAELAQWRVSKRMMGTFAASLFGGIQFGGERKPDAKQGRVCMDVVSCYPFMAMQELPRIRDAVVERGLRPNAVLVKVIATQHEPALFTRTPQGTTAYDDTLSGWYVREELDYHVACGRVRVHSVLNSVTFVRHEKYLAQTIDHLFTHREKYRRGTPERSVVKSSLNGLLGKFASPISPWRTPKPLELEHARQARHTTTLELGASSLIEDHALRNIYPRHSNVIWTAVTYARARVKLWQKMDEITGIGGKVLWVHTDCVIADIPAARRMTYGNALGDWRKINE